MLKLMQIIQDHLYLIEDVTEISVLQHNALSAITPATLDVLLNNMLAIDNKKATNEMREECGMLGSVMIQCFVQMVHAIHASSPDKVFSCSYYIIVYIILNISIKCCQAFHLWKGDKI